MRSAILTLAFVLGIHTAALATGSLSFEASGYCVDITVGYDKSAVVAGVKTASPGSPRETRIPLELIEVETFDVERKVLVLRFKNPGRPDLPADFVLTVNRDIGVLRTEDKSLTGPFGWGM